MDDLPRPSEDTPRRAAMTPGCARWTPLFPPRAAPPPTPAGRTGGEAQGAPPPARPVD